MNRQELISVLASKTGKPLTEAKEFLEAFTEMVTETLIKGDKVTLIGFGTWDVQDVPASTGPQLTHETIVRRSQFLVW